jgi:hypothetical protein
VKTPKWLRWDSSDTKSEDLKKVRRQTDQRMKQQQDAQKEQRNEAEKKNGSLSTDSARDRQGAGVLTGRRSPRVQLAIQLLDDFGEAPSGHASSPSLPSLRAIFPSE